MQKANMNKTFQTTGAARFLFIAAALVVVVAGMRAAESLLTPFLLAIFIAIISAPPLFWLQQRGLSMTMAALVVIVGVSAAGFAVLLLVGSSLDDFASNLPIYRMRLEQSLLVMLQWLHERGLNLSPQAALKFLDPQAAASLAQRMISALGSVLAHAALILLTVIFILVEASSFPTKLRAIWGDTAQFPQLQMILSNIQRYIVIKTVMSLATGVLVSIWLALLHVDYAILWGLLAFLLNYVPNIGSLLAAVPAVLLAFIQFGTLSALYAAGGYFVINMIIGNILEPRLMGHSLGLSPLIVFLSLVFWGWVLGPIGMLLSVPLTMTVKIALESHPDTHWIAILLSAEKPSPPSV
jgi:AI-2 transport protein TqsA